MPAAAGRGSRAARRGGIVAIGALLSGLVLMPGPTSADPSTPKGTHDSSLTISQVKTQLDALDHQAEVAAEEFNTVRVHIQAARARMTGLQADLQRERSRVAALRREIVGAALSDFTSGGGLSTSASFLVAKKPREFIEALASNAVVQHQQAGLLTQFRQQQNQLGVQERQAQRELSAIQADRVRLARHKADVEGKLAAAKALLGRLQAEERRRVLALRQKAEAAAAAAATPTAATPRAVAATVAPTATTSRAADRPPTHSSAPASGRASVAVATALAQLGKPYVWGTAGPSTFDCSGLTSYAWAAAGVSLPHASSVQSQSGIPVSISDLRPGDLVFYYSPVHHVAMYIGNGQVVHAPRTGTFVEVVPLSSMPISWARRVG